MRMEQKAAAAVAALTFGITGVFSGIVLVDTAATERGVVTAGMWHGRSQP
jgi:hypothetical protein